MEFTSPIALVADCKTVLASWAAAGAHSARARPKNSGNANLVNLTSCPQITSESVAPTAQWQARRG